MFGFGASSASKIIIDQEPSVTHRRSRKQNALAIRREPLRDVTPRVEKWQRANLRSIGKAGWVPAYFGKSREQRGLMSDADIVFNNPD